MLGRRVTLALALGLGLAVGGAWGQTSTEALEWVAGDLPPFAWMSASGPQGYAHELALALAGRLGRPQTVSYVPWARAVKLAEEGDHVGVFPLARTPDREQRFRWLIPLMTVRYSFVGKLAVRTMDMAELRDARVGVLRGSPIIKNLQAERFSHVVDGKDYRELLRLLDLGTIQVIYAGAPMLEAAIDEYGYQRAQFTTHGSLGEATLYMGASLRLAEDEAQRWLRAYQQLDADGTVTRLRKRYFR